MSKNLKSLNSGVLKCGASQFKANIPSIQGVTLNPPTDNPVNFVFESTKVGSDAFMGMLADLNIPHYTEEFTEGGIDMIRIYAAIPAEASYFSEHELYFTDTAKIFCYQSGILPPNWMLQILREGTNGSIVYFVNSIETTDENFLINSDEAVTIVFMKEIILSSGALSLAGSSTLIINSTATMMQSSIEIASYDPEDPDNCNTTIVLAAQSDNTHIANNAIVGDVNNLYYSGEWNTTTRAWFAGNIFNLNNNTLDPKP